MKMKLLRFGTECLRINFYMTCPTSHLRQINLTINLNLYTLLVLKMNDEGATLEVRAELYQTIHVFLTLS